jgi:hypothetical protein
VQGCAQKSQRPANVPTSAVNVDGAYIQCSVASAAQANRCTVYGDHTGDVLASGLFVLSGAGRAAVSEDLKFAAFDGTQIYLADARALYPVLLDELAVMQRRLRVLAGDGAVACGRMRANLDLRVASDCARNALASKKPFYVYYILQRDSPFLADGIAGNSAGEINTKWPSLGPPHGAQLSDSGYILTQVCPKPVKLWGSNDDKLTCFPPMERGAILVDDTLDKSEPDPLLGFLSACASRSFALQ